MASHYEELNAAFGVRRTILEKNDSNNLLLSVVEVIKGVYCETKNMLGDGYKFEQLVESSSDYGVSVKLVTRMFHESNNQREFSCIYSVEQAGTDVVISTDIGDYLNLTRSPISVVEQGIISDIHLNVKRFLAEQLSRRLRLPNISAVHRAIYDHIRGKDAKLIALDIANVHDAHDEGLNKGFEELSWLFKRHGLVTEWQRGGRTVVKEEGCCEVDMPSVFTITAPSAVSRLEFWTSGEARAVHTATITFPGGHQSMQIIHDPSLQKTLDKLMVGISIPAFISI